VKKIVFFILISCLICSCATAYKRASKSTSNGYFETQLQNNIYEISFNGNEFTNIKKAQDYALLRAAEVCLDNGFKTFVIVNSSNNTEVSTRASSTYDYYTKQSHTSVYTSEYPKINLAIQCSKNGDLVFDAQQIKDNLRKKYNLK